MKVSWQLLCREKGGSGRASMMDREVQMVNTYVTHRLCTHRLHTRKMAGDAARHPSPVWPCDPTNPRATGDQPRGGRAERCGLHRTYYSGIERGVRNVSLVN